MTRERLLPIGRFARLCRLSVKQLRHYDELGLLPPAAVDPATGYRSYAPEQAREALTIALLRTLEVPLPAIRDLLGADEETAARLLAAQRDRVEGELERRRGILRAIEHLRTHGLRGPQVTLGHEPDRRLLVAHATGDPADVGAVTSACISRLLSRTRAAGIDWTPPIIGLFPLDITEPDDDAARTPDGSLHVRAGVQTDADAPGLDAEALPGGPAAVTTHVGPYAGLPLTYHTLLAWAYEHGHTPAGMIREIYLDDPNTTDPAQLVTRLVVPVATEAAR
jgi:DNA-binding transcriptional MerR regulator/DNA gyrase inhibitor GyrI